MAARGVNKTILLGNIGNEPELRYIPNGNAVASVSIATSDTWKDKNTGEPQERTEWHRVVFFGKIAEIVGQYVHKGSKLYVEGRLQTRKWTDQQGVERYTTEVIVDMGGTMQLLDGKQENAGQNQAQQTQQRPPQQQNRPQQNQQAAPPQNNDWDDIPFTKHHSINGV